MRLEFKLNGEAPEGNPGKPSLGIIEGYIQEGINQVSTIELILVSNKALTEDECAAYIGIPATLKLGGNIGSEYFWSRFDGLVYEFHVLDAFGLQKDLFKYQMIIRPPLWNLNYMVRARSFPDKSRIDVVEEVLKPYNFKYEVVISKEDKTAKFPKCKQILQNKISDLTFVQNLLTEAGANYYFCAPKDGDNPEYLKIIESQAQFLDAFKQMKVSDTKISRLRYEPGANLAGADCRVDWLEVHHRASIAQTYAIANLGDGKAAPVDAPPVTVGDKDEGGAYCSYGCEGEEAAVAKQAALTRAQFFKTKQVLYEGRSNYFVLQPGEKFAISDVTASTVLHEVLMTTVYHHFRQTPHSATRPQVEQHPDYGNLFSAVKKLADYRPDQTFGKTITEFKRAFSHAHSHRGTHHSVSEPRPTDLMDIAWV